MESDWLDKNSHLPRSQRPKKPTLVGLRYTREGCECGKDDVLLVEGMRKLEEIQAMVVELRKHDKTGKEMDDCYRAYCGEREAKKREKKCGQRKRNLPETTAERFYVMSIEGEGGTDMNAGWRKKLKMAAVQDANVMSV